VLLAVTLVGAAAWQPTDATPASAPTQDEGPGITLFQPLVSARFAAYEKVLLVANVFVALAGLSYVPSCS
jgi:hypothetical protein